MRQFVVLVAWVLLLGTPAAVRAIEELEAEEGIADLMPSRLPGEERPHDLRTRQWAVLPQLGYGPDTGLLAGVKLAHRDLWDTGWSADLDSTYAANEQQSIAFSIGSSHLMEDRLLVLFRTRYHFDPQRDFFGLGNNDLLDCRDHPQDPDCRCQRDDPGYPDCPEDGPFSTHAFQDIGGAFTIGWRPFERLAFNVSVGLRQVDIRKGDRKDEIAFTPVKFPELPGIEGGVVNPLAFSLVWNTRDDVMRPTRGWRTILKIIHANHAFSDFKFTRFIADFGYLRALSQGRFVFGLRVNGEYVEAASGQVPFWELSEIGGQDTLRGFFPHRFVGEARVLLNGELRARVAEFDFYRLYHVKVDLVGFGDGGRVFIDRDELEDEFALDSEIVRRVIDDFQYSYGGGIRIVLSNALVARIDAGFSDEETGLLYLSFGHTF